MKIISVRSAFIGISLLLLSLAASLVAQAETGYPMMGRGEHRAMMGYGVEQGKTGEEERPYEQMPYGGWMGYGQMGPGMMDYGQMGQGMMGYGHMGPGMMGYGHMGPGMTGYGHMGPGMMGYGHMGPGMMGYGHMGRGMMGGMWAVMQLDLTEEQEQKVREIHSRLRRENWARMGDMLEHQDKLAELHAAEVPDAKAIGKVYAAIFDIKRQKIEAAIRAQNEVRALLTEEQKKDLEQREGRFGRHMRGYGRMW